MMVGNAPRPLPEGPPPTWLDTFKAIGLLILIVFGVGTFVVGYIIGAISGWWQ